MNLIRKIKRKIRHQRNAAKVSGLLREFKHLDTYKIEIKDKTVLFDTTDDFSKLWFHQANRTAQTHEPNATRQFVNNVKEGDIVFDIGSLIGYFACLGSELVGEKGAVHVFEIDERCLPIIEKSMSLSNYKNIVLNNLAVSDHSGKEYMSQTKRFKLGEMLSEKSQKRVIEISAITIDQYVNKIGVIPDFVKIDVEGAEMKVLKGMTEVLKARKTKLLVEVHPEKLIRHFDTNYADVIEFLLDMGYQIELTPENSDGEEPFQIIKDKSLVLQGNCHFYCYPDTSKTTSDD